MERESVLWLTSEAYSGYKRWALAILTTAWILHMACLIFVIQQSVKTCKMSSMT